MPIFASAAAHAVIDTFALLLWHRMFFSKMCRDTLRLEYVKALIDFYFQQCQPGPLPLFNPSFLRQRQIGMLEVPSYDNPAAF